MCIVLMAFISVMVLAGFLALFFRRTVEDTLCIANGFIIFVLYIFGNAGNLYLGWCLLLLLIPLGCLVVAVCVISGKVSLKEVGAIYITQGTASLLLIFMFWMFVIRDRGLYHWDEFSHWGLAVKNMWLFDEMPYSELSTVSYKSYPPAMALFEYYFTCFDKEIFREYAMYYAYDFFAYSCLLFVYSAVTKGKSTASKIAVFISVFAMPLIFFKSYYTLLLVDAVLAIMYAALVLRWWGGRNEDNLNFLNLIFLCFVGTLTKSSGFGIVMIAVIEMLVGEFMKKNKSRQGILRVLCLGVVSLSARISWSICLVSHKVDTSSYSIGSGPEKSREVVWNTLKTFINEIMFGEKANNIMHFSVLIWMILLFIIQLWLYKKVNRKEIFLLNFGEVIYLSFVFIVYAYNMSESTGLSLSSYPRYVCPIILGTMIAEVLLMFELSKGVIQSIVICGVVVLLAQNGILETVTNVAELVYKSKTIQDNYKYTVLERVAPGERVCFIAQNTAGTPYNMSIYVNAPVQFVCCKSYSIGNPNGENDIYTVSVSIEELEDFLLNTCEYLYIYQADQQFMDNYKSLFEDEIWGRTLYKVEQIDGGCRLIMVGDS